MSIIPVNKKQFIAFAKANGSRAAFQQRTIILPSISSPSAPFIGFNPHIGQGVICPFTGGTHVDRRPYIDYLLGITDDPVARRELVSAFGFAWEVHMGILRADKKTPYIDHPFAGLRIFVDEWGLFDTESHQAILLHDVEEDIKVTPDIIAAHFGKNVAFLVEGVTELGKEPGFSGIEPSNRRKWEKILKLSFRDIRVILIKFSDRLHNMRTLSTVPPDKQKPKAEETLWYYRPLADALGMWGVKREFEDLSFQYLYPDIYRQVAEIRQSLIDASRKGIEKVVVSSLLERLPCGKYGVNVVYEARGAYEIIERLKIRGEKLRGIEKIDMGFYLSEYAEDDIAKLRLEDIWRINVVCNRSEEARNCYVILGAVHRIFPPAEGGFTDHIAAPCPNGHQFLQAYVNTSLGRILIHIQDRKMMRSKHLGIIADARRGQKDWYKEYSRFLGGILGTLIEEPLISDWEAYDLVGRYSASIECFPFDYDNPPGKKKKKYSFPFGATVYDFAAAIHPHIMLRTKGAIVNGVEVPANYRLKHGDRIRVITDLSISSRVDWFDHVQTPKARKALRSELKKAGDRVVFREAMEVLDRESLRFYIGAKELVRSGIFDRWAKQSGINNVETLLSQIGSGEKRPKLVVEELVAMFRSLYRKEKRALEKTKEKIGPEFKKSLYDTYDIAIYLDRDRRGILDKLAHDFNMMGFNIASNYTVDLSDGRKAIILRIDVVKKGIAGGILTEIQHLQIRGIAAQFSEKVLALSDKSRTALLKMESGLADILK